MNTPQENKEIVLAERPSGVPAKNTFGINDIAMPGLTEDQVLLKSLYVSVDPGMRGFMDEGEDGDNIGKQMIQVGERSAES